ncbi:MlaD family protein [Nocardia sp. NPDC051756]|uniref:MlaD family protein n=1 Tax=Nocardia sp. NPDC051756 TaxID=3154751 RepID=UPI00343A1132
MVHRFLASRGFMSTIGVVILCALVFAGYSIAFDTGRSMRGYCALMPDSVGLYTGNHVTLHGVTIGTVTAIEPQGEKVRVDFDVDATHPLRGRASATTVSATLVADRDLAVFAEPDGPEWQPGVCITHTLTPKSMTQTITALGKLADELNGADNPVDRESISNGVAALDKATAGTGPRINELIKKLGVALNSPDAAIGHIGALIDALSSLSASAAGGWSDIKTLLTPFASTLEFVNEKMWVPITEIIDSLRVIIPLVNDITTTFGEPILQVLDATVPVLRLIAANVGTLQQMIDLVPAVVGAFGHAIDPETGRLAVTYAAPKVAVSQPDADTACAAVNAVLPGGCATAANGLTDVALIPLVLGIAGAR